MRIERRMRTASYAVNQSKKSARQDNTHELRLSKIKIFDCSECGLLFPTLNDQNIHEEKHGITSQISQITITPHESWLSKSLPNLEELLETIPSNCLVFEEDDLKLRKDFKEIRCE